MIATLISMTIFEQISSRIIKQQEIIIGPVAWAEARKVEGLTVVDQNEGTVSTSGDPKLVLESLVARYAALFGKASNEVCKEAVQDLIAELPQEQVPATLK